MVTFRIQNSAFRVLLFKRNLSIILNPFFDVYLVGNSSLKLTIYFNKLASIA